MNDKDLVKIALEAREKSYAPYSRFHVGAALLCVDGTVYTGCNIENAAYEPTNCAERTAFFKAISEGHRGFVKMAIVGGGETDGAVSLCAPCGVCRQVMMEFCNKDFQIVLGTMDGVAKIFTLEQLLPEGFGPKNLGLE